MLRSSEWGMILAWKTLLVWPEWKESLIPPVSQSQRITLQSSEPDTRMSPSVLKLTVLTQPLCLASFLSTSSRRTRSYKTHDSTLINDQGRALSFWIEAHSESHAYREAKLLSSIKARNHLDRIPKTKTPFTKREQRDHILVFNINYFTEAKRWVKNWLQRMNNWKDIERGKRMEIEG